MLLPNVQASVREKKMLVVLVDVLLSPEEISNNFIDMSQMHRCAGKFHIVLGFPKYTNLYGYRKTSVLVNVEYR